VLLVLVLTVAGCVVLNLVIPPRPAWMQAVVEAFTEDPSTDEPPEGPHPGLFSPQFVQHRLDLLAAEIRHLDEVRDGSVFALAFRTWVVRDAHQALLDDASRLAVVPTLDLGDITLDDGLLPVRGPCEELEF
jgi:hypothetical protein